MFTAEQRAGYLGASDMRYVMNDVPAPELLRWWECKVGIRELDPPNYAMRLGSAVGDIILDEYGRQCGAEITRRQEVVPSGVNKRLRSTLDGFDAARRAVIEAKFCSPYFARDQIFSTYYPQVALQMHCTDAETGYLVVGQGTADPIEIECIRDPFYEGLLLDRAASMLECMDTLTPPVAIHTPVAIPPERWRTVNLVIDQPNWADEMVTLLLVYENTREAADTHEEVGRLAKSLVPDDVGRVLTDTHTIARNKKGSLAITVRRNAA